jgi:hypothetical protein
MSDIKSEIQHLREKTAHNRREFLRTEVQACLITLEMARSGFSGGNISLAQKELTIAERGIAVIERLLREAPEERIEIEPKLEHLRALLASVSSDLNTSGS